jgi:hypothetical protein
MASDTYPSVGSKVTQFNQGWVSKWNTRFDDGYIAEINKYGQLSSIFDGLQLAGRTLELTTRNPKWFEILEWEKTVKINAAINTGGAGDDISFVVHTDDRDVSGNVPIQVGDAVLIPAAYQTPGEDRVYVCSGYVSGTYTATLKPLSNAGTIITASQIGTQIPAGTVLTITSSYHGFGTGQPTGQDTTRAEKSTKTQIIKTSMNVEGGLTSLKWREVMNSEGNPGLWLEGQELAENTHDKKIDGALLVNEQNDNATLVATSQYSGSNAITAGMGYWNSAQLYGQDHYYTPGSVDRSFFADYKDLALSQNMMTKEIMLGVGTDLLRDIEDGGLDLIGNYSGGSSLFLASDKIGFGFKYYVANGYTFRIQEFKSWGNPLRFGNKAYDWTKRGLFIPEMYGDVTMGGKTEKLPQLMVGYLKDRERIIRVLGGMDGRESVAVSEYDGSNLYMLTELAPLAFRANMLVTVNPS